MIIRKVTVSNWRALVKPFEVSLDESITILHGRNGEGKSSLVEALRMAFFDRHGITGEAITRIRPWGRDLGPRVEVEFEEKGATYRVVKQFVTNRLCAVARLEQGEWVPFKEGDTGEEWLRGLFGARAPGRGLSKQEHLGLAQVLWIPQGMPGYGDLPETLRARLTPSGAETPAAAGPASRLEELLHERYSQFYTDKGSERKGADSLAAAESALELKRARLEELRGQLAGMEETVRELEDDTRLAVEKRQQIAVMEKQLGALNEAAARYQKDRIAFERSQSVAVEIDGRHARLASRIELLEEARVELGREKKTDGTHRAALDTYRTQLRRAEERLAATGRELGRVDEAGKGVAEARARAVDARLIAATNEELGELGKRREEIERLQKAIDADTTRIGALRAPERNEIDALRAHHERLKDAERELAALQVSLDFTADARVRWITRAGEPAGEHELAADQALSVRGLGAIEASIEGVGSLRIRGPVGDTAEGLEHTIVAARARLDEAVERYGTANCDVLLDRLTEAGALERESTQRRERIDALLDGKDTRTLAGRLATLEATLGALLDKHPAWRHEAPDAEGLEREARERDEQVRGKKQALELEQARVQGEKSRAQELLAGARAAQSDAAARMERLEQRIERLAEGATPEELRTALESLDRERAKALAEKQQAADRLEAYDADPERQRVELADRIQRMRERIDQLGHRVSRATGEINSLGGRGLYSQVTELEEEVEAEAGRLATRRLRASALKLLWETISEVRRERRDSIHIPVATRAISLFTQINSRRRGSLVLGDTLEVEGFTPEGLGAGTVCPVGELSGGEREQLYLALRLALAERLIPRDAGRHLMVLDDFLTATDDVRLSRIKELVGSLSERYQFLILTCHPERYAALPGAHLVGMG